MLADELDFVVGVDTHLDEHVLAVVAAATGAVLARHLPRIYVEEAELERTFGDEYRDYERTTARLTPGIW